MSGNQSIQHNLDYVISCFQEKDIIIQPFRLSQNSEVQLIERLKKECYDLLVVSGGDGTVNSIVNLMLKNNIDLPIGVIPSGTCNDFARSVGVGNTLHDAIDIILSDYLISVDVGIINDDQYFFELLCGREIS